MKKLTWVLLALLAFPAMAQNVVPGPAINPACNAQTGAYCTVWTPAQWVTAWQSVVSASGGYLTGGSLFGTTTNIGTISGGTIAPVTLAPTGTGSTGEIGGMTAGGVALSTVAAQGAAALPKSGGTMTGALIAPTISGDVSASTVLPAGANTARTNAARAADRFNVMDWGFDQTGATDNFSKIETLFAAIPSCGTVYFPTGVYNFATAPYVPRQCILIELDGGVQFTGHTIANADGSSGVVMGRLASKGFMAYSGVDGNYWGVYTSLLSNNYFSSILTGSISGTTLTVPSAPSQPLAVGSILIGAGVSDITQIQAIPAGGLAGTYTISPSQTAASTYIKSVVPAVTFTGSISGTTLLVSAVGSGQTIQPGDSVVAPGVSVPTTIVSGPGGVGAYVVSTSQTAASQTLYGFRNGEKAAAFDVALSQDPDVSLAGLTYDYTIRSEGAVGRQMWGYIDGGNLFGSAWGSVAGCAIRTGGDGACIGSEIDMVNTGISQPLYSRRTSKTTVLAASQGPNKATVQFYAVGPTYDVMTAYTGDVARYFQALYTTGSYPLVAAYSVDNAGNIVTTGTATTGPATGNFAVITGAAGTGLPGIHSASTTNATAGLQLYTKGSAPIYLGTGSGVQLEIIDSAAANIFEVRGGATGVAPTIIAAGSDTNIDIVLAPQGTGLARGPTATAGDSSTAYATTAFVATSFAPKAAPAFTTSLSVTSSSASVPACVNYTGSGGQNYCLYSNTDGSASLYNATSGHIDLSFDKLGNGYTLGHHQFSTALTPTITANACGTATQGTISGTDQSMLVTVGTAAVTSCTVGFGGTWPITPHCVFSPANAIAAAQSTTAAYVSAQNTTAFTITGAALAGAAYNVHCQ